MHALNGTAVAIAQIFAIIALGWLVGQKLPTARTFTKEFWDKLARLVYVLFVPPLILNAILSNRLEVAHARFAIATAVGSILAIVLSVLATRVFFPRNLTSKQRATLLATVFHPNAVFLGFPLIEGTVGKEGMAFAAIFGAIEWPLVTVASIYILRPSKLRETIARLARDPLMVTIVVGFLWSLLRLPFPEAVRKPCAMLGDVAGPAALIVVGARLALHDLRQHAGGVAWAAFVKLAAIPIMAFALSRVLSLPEIPHQVFTLLMATPIAAGMTIIVSANDGDTELCANATSITTLASLVTLILAAGVI